MNHFAIECAEVIQGECLANVHTLRGTRYRDPVRWYRTIDMMRDFHAAHMVPAHGRPVSGEAAVAEVLSVYRDAIQFIHHQAIRHMNRGLTQDELTDAIPSLPPRIWPSMRGSASTTARSSIACGRCTPDNWGGSTAMPLLSIRCHARSVHVARST